MKTTITKKDGALEIRLEGRLDTLSSPEVLAEAEGQLDASVKDISIDCQALEYISSSGLRVLMTLYKHAVSQGGGLYLHHVAPQVGDVLKITGTAELFHLD